MNKQSVATQVSLNFLNDESFGYYLSKLKESKTDILLISACEFYYSGEERTESLKAMKKYIALFRAEGYEPIVWTNSLGYGVERDEYFREEFKDSYMLTDSTGRTSNAVCPYDEKFSDVMAENVRDFIRAGAGTILWDDDLLQSFRPGAFCCCSEHLGRLNSVLNSDYVPGDIPFFFTGKPNRERSTFLEIMGEGLYSFCRKMRKAADEIDETVNMGLCASFTHYDCEGADINKIVEILSGKNCKPLLRFSGAPYWPFIAKRFPGQSLSDVIEFVRMQYFWYKDKDYVLMDENDSYPRDPEVIPPYSCELYDKATLTMPGLIRHKYFLCYRHDKPVEEYIKLHIGNFSRDETLLEMFDKTVPLGVGIFEAEHKIKEMDLYDSYPGNAEYMSDFSQPLAGIFFSRFGISTRYSDENYTAVFGENARFIPDSEFHGGLLLDLTAAKILEEKGIDTGINEHGGSGFSFVYKNPSGLKFCVLNFSIYDVDFDPDSSNYSCIFNEEYQRMLLEMFEFLGNNDNIPYIGFIPGLDIIASEAVSDGSVSVLLLNDNSESLKNIRIGCAGNAHILMSDGNWGVSDGKVICREIPAHDFSAVKFSKKKD